MSAPVSFPLLLALAVGPALAPGALAADGAVVFENHCAACHGLDGKARTPAGRKLGARDLSESKVTDEALVRQVLDGVKDAAGKDRMPAFRDRLTADEVAAVRERVKAFRKK